MSKLKSSRNQCKIIMYMLIVCAVFLFWASATYEGVWVIFLANVAVVFVFIYELHIKDRIKQPRNK